jgi:vacuolar-type H+-ATPase subunit F/Vma7
VIPLLIGDAADARGFSLAGVDSYVCTSREQIEERLRAVTGERFIIFFSASAAGLIADRIAAWRRDGTGPPFVVLPR